MRLMEICMKDNEKVTKRIFFTKLNLAKLEGKLAQMEKEGYRLTRVSGLYRFEFTKSKCKDTRYFCTYDEPRGIKSPDFEITQDLVHNYQAERIRDSLSVGAAGLTDVYRTVQADCDLSEISLERDKYICKVYLRNFFMFLSFFVLLTVGVVYSDGTPRIVLRIIAIILAVPALWNEIAFTILFFRTEKPFRR